MKEIPESVIPRRNRIDHFTHAEKAIWDAIQAVEVAGAHTLLTEAVVLLGQAKDKVANYVDEQIAEQASEEIWEGSRRITSDELRHIENQQFHNKP